MNVTYISQNNYTMLKKNEFLNKTISKNILPLMEVSISQATVKKLSQATVRKLLAMRAESRMTVYYYYVPLLSEH